MDFIKSLLVVPLETLEEAQHHSIFIVVTRRQLQVSYAEELPEVIQMSFFAFTKVLSLEEKALVVATWNNEEYVLKGRLVFLNFLIQDIFWDVTDILKLAAGGLVSSIGNRFKRFELYLFLTLVFR